MEWMKLLYLLPTWNGRTDKFRKIRRCIQSNMPPERKDNGGLYWMKMKI